MKKIKDKKIFLPVLYVAVAVLLFVGAYVSHHSASAMSVTTGRVAAEGGGGGAYYPAVRTATLPPETLPANPPTTTAVTLVTPNATQASGTYFQNFVLNTTLDYGYNRYLNNPKTIVLPSSDTQVTGYRAGLSNPNITIGYDVSIFDANDNTKIFNSGDTVLVGEQLLFKFAPYVSQNIYWFGTGFSLDSPFGEWRTNATPPDRVNNMVTCVDKDFTDGATYNDISNNTQFKEYIPLVVNPPARTLTNTTGLSCGSLTTNNDGSMTATCTVLAAGTITPTFHFDSTYGKFYYRYYDPRDQGNLGGPGCYGNNIPLSSDPGSLSGYTLTVPSADIPFTLTAANGANPPTTPTVSCPATSVTEGGDVTVTVNGSTANDSGNVSYAVDWLSQNPHTPNSGWSDPVAGGSSATLTKSGGYPNVGAYQIYAVAKDSSGVLSSWSSPCTVIITNGGTGPSAALVAMDKNGVSQPNGGAVIAPGDPATLQWFCANSASASIDQSVGTVTPTLGGTKSVSPNGDTTYTLTCTGPDGSTATDSTTVTVNNGSACTLTASPTSIVIGGQTQLTWGSSGTSVSIDHGIGSVSPTSGGSVTAKPTQTTTYTATCSGIGVGNVTLTASATVNVSGPTVLLTATPPSVVKGASSVLNWVAQNATSCVGTNFSTGASKPTSGYVSVSPVTDTQYSVTCTDAAGNPAYSAATVGVRLADLNLSATPNLVRKGDNTTISWNVVGTVNSCSIAGPGLSSAAISGSQVVPISAQSVYTLTCSAGPIASPTILTQSATVNIAPSFKEF